MKRPLFWLLVPCAGLVLALLVAATSPSATSASEAVAAVQRTRAGLVAALTFADSRPDIFPSHTDAEPRVLTPAERAEVLAAWQSVSDRLLALDTVRRAHRDFALREGQARRAAFHIYRAAFLAQYRFALDWIAHVERDPGLPTVLDEPLPEIGLPAGSYDRLKLRMLNALIASEFATLEGIASAGRRGPPAALAEGVRADRDRVWEMGRSTGLLLTAANAANVVEKIAFRAWFPVQSSVAEWMGDVKVWRTDRSLIAVEQRRALADRLRPGDVLLTRREWFLSNLGLPGYWSHAALYIGTPEERARFFDDPETRAWVIDQGEASGGFEALLTRAHAKAHASSGTADHGNPVRVLEAVGEGVIFTSIEHAAEADSVAALRPRRSRRDKAVALWRAFGYAGRPYDFDFDFLTDAELVCTELVYKAYQPAEGARGLDLPLTSILGRLALPANGLASLFDEEHGGTDRQFELVTFLDGDERSGSAHEADEAAFRSSWRRPKWHILTADAERDPTPAAQSDPASRSERR